MKPDVTDVKLEILNGLLSARDRPAGLIRSRRSGARQCLGGAVSGTQYFLTWKQSAASRNALLGLLLIGAGQRPQSFQIDLHQAVMTLIGKDAVAL